MKHSFDVSGQKTTKKWPQMVAGLSAAGGAFAVGSALGWPANALPLFVDSNSGYFPLTETERGLVASIITIGCAISCLPIGFLMKKFGRKWTMLSLVVPFVIGWALVIFAKSFSTLFIGRFIIGIAGGAFCVSAPQYSAEIAEKEIRGIVGTFFQLLIIAGILFSYITSAVLSLFVSSIICGAIPIVFGIIFCFMPESPVYLVITKQDDEAIKAFKWLRGNAYDPQDEINELKNDILEKENNQVTFLTVVRRKSTIKALIIGFGLMIFQQMSGINVVIFYTTMIFELAKTGIDGKLCTIIIGTVHLIATLAGALLVDKAGRKILLLISIIVMTITLICLGIFFYILDNDPETSEKLGWLPLTSLSLYLIAFAIGYGPVPWLMLGEIYTNEYNAIASPITGAFNWGLAFIITSTFSMISGAVGLAGTFWIFAALSILGTLFTFFLVPETKGKSINDIQRMLNGE
ncbi:CLUMA_CG017642, isoform A [Clunio marinus]|uniref:Facilitated trehalose transporter Tret1 n=1 Tax=Clunio marinus TaxID=568069 RepID=A0A1J1IWI2_9DIPT|nr:CLUMA_CG017642, isoform A [Clunio marinus]